MAHGVRRIRAPSPKDDQGQHTVFVLLRVMPGAGADDRLHVVVAVPTHFVDPMLAPLVFVQTPVVRTLGVPVQPLLG
jgi:hypothetical protein